MKYIDETYQSTKLNTVEGVTYITFPKLVNAGVKHGFTTRLGGVSLDYLGTMNVSYTRGDKKENVDENHRRLARAIGYDYKKLVFSDQVHDIVIREIKEEDAGKGIIKESDIKAVDGIMTDVKNLPLMTFYADCVPLLFYDPVNQVIAMAHSGWKGTVAKIGTVMVEKLKNRYGTNPCDLICAIGPSICKDCYEVSEDLYLKFSDSFEKEIVDKIFYKKDNGKYQLDLHMAVLHTLISAGVKRENIDLTDICTCCNPELLFSHRASKGLRGNNGCVMVLE